VSVVFGYISACSQLLVLEVFGKEVCFHIQKEDAENFYRVHNRRGQQEDAPLQLEIGQCYEDEEKELWQVKDKIEYICQHPDGTKIDFQVIQYEAYNSKGLKRRFRSNGKCVEIKGANLVRIAEKVSLIAECGITRKSFAETLREQAANFNSIEARVERIKEMAAEAASNGKFKVEINSSLWFDMKLHEELEKQGFCVIVEYQTNRNGYFSPTSHITKVWVDWSEKQ